MATGLRSLGRVNVGSAGTPVRITANESDPAAQLDAHTIFIQPWHANTGRIWIGVSDLNKTTGAGVYAVLPIPTDNSLPPWSATIVEAPVGFNCSQIYIDAEVGDEGAVVSILQGVADRR